MSNKRREYWKRRGRGRGRPQWKADEVIEAEKEAFMQDMKEIKKQNPETEKE